MNELCKHCKSEDLFITQEDGNILSVCNDCGEVIENGIVIQEGRLSEELQT